MVNILGIGLRKSRKVAGKTEILKVLRISFSPQISKQTVKKKQIKYLQISNMFIRIDYQFNTLVLIYNLKFKLGKDDHNRYNLKYTNGIYYFLSHFIWDCLVGWSETSLASIKNILENSENGVEIWKNVASPQRYGGK